MVPQLHPVQSSNIDAVGYDPETQTLSVRFHSGDTFHYAGVPPGEYQDLISAGSIGGQFHRRIKGRYGFSRG